MKINQKTFAYSSLELKAVDEEKRILRGIATTPTADRSGDIVEPKGAEFTLPIPFLWQHDSSQPIGEVTKATVTSKGIEVEVQIAKITEPGKLKDRVDEAWQTMKAGLVKGLSIGFRSKEHAFLDDGSYGIRFLKWLWLELSAVTIPANGEASIATIKSLDTALRAATGQTGNGSTATPGGSGTSTTLRQKGNSTMKTLQQMRDERTTKAARFSELVELLKTVGHETTDDETAEMDTLEGEIKSLDLDIRVARFAANDASTAKAAAGTGSAAAGASRSTGMSFSKNADPDDKFKGQGFVRKLLAQAASFHARKHGNHLSASDFAAMRWGKTNPQLVQLIKANEVAGGGTGSGEWGAELVGIDNRYNGDFVAYLYAMTIYDRLGLRQAPKNVSVKGQDGAAIGYWVGESKGIPVSKPDFSSVDLTTLKAAGIVVASKELLADSDPAAEMLIRDSLVQAISQRIDQTFLSATAASAGVSPAGILNGVSALHTSGTDEAAVRSMIKALYSQFITDKNASGLKLVMAPGMAKAIGLIVNALGQTSFPGLGTAGGSLLGDDVITGDNVDPSTVLLIKPSDIWQIGDSGVEVSMSDSAMIEQNSAPTGATDTPTASSVTMTSMFQEDSVAIKVVRRTSYKKRRTNAVQYVDDADFDGTVS